MRRTRLATVVGSSLALACLASPALATQVLLIAAGGGGGGGARVPGGAGLASIGTTGNGGLGGGAYGGGGGAGASGDGLSGTPYDTYSGQGGASYPNFALANGRYNDVPYFGGYGGGGDGSNDGGGGGGGGYDGGNGGAYIAATGTGGGGGDSYVSTSLIAGSSGANSGPGSITIAFGGQTMPFTFDFIGAAQTYLVATTGGYTLTAAGAQGGAGRGNSGGDGAVVSDLVMLTAGDVLDIEVGGNGGDGDLAGGGGGGSFVYDLGPAAVSTSVPEPGSLTLFAIAVPALWARRRRAPRRR